MPILIFLLLFTSVWSVAATRPCPSTFRFYDIGYNAAQMQEACGAPIHIEKSTEEASSQQAVTLLIYEFANTDPTKPQAPPVVFKMANNKVIGIKVANTDTNSTGACGSQINMNDKYEKVISLCGAPVYLDQGTQAVPGKMQQVEIWTYQKNQFLKPVKMKFVNGILESVDE